MPKRRQSLRSRVEKEGNAENATSSESEEEKITKRIKRSRLSIKNQEENKEVSQPIDDSHSEDEPNIQSRLDELPMSSSEFEGDVDSNDDVAKINSGRFDSSGSLFRSYRFFSEDEDSQEKPSNFESKYAEELGQEDPDDQDEYFVLDDNARNNYDDRSVYIEDLKDRIRIVSFHAKQTEIVFMDHPVSLPLFGHLKVTLLSGKATIHGYELIQKKPRVVFSQKQTGLLTVDSLPFAGNNSDTRRGLRKLLKKFLFHVDPKALKEKFKGHLRRFTVALVLQELPLPPALQFLQLHSKEAISFKNIHTQSESLYTSVLQNEKNVLRFCDEHEQLFHVIERHLRAINKKKKSEREKNAEIDYSSWSSENDSENPSPDAAEHQMSKKIAEPVIQSSENEQCNISSESKPLGSRILIYGPKKTGKSTMLRYLINKFLNTHSEVFFLDTDPGQTEFTPPGVVSLSKITEPLFGPPYTHIQKPLKAIFTGTITSETCPQMHYRSIINLIGYFNKHYPEGLLLVNTMGWIVGVGELILDVITKNSKPTVEIEMCSSLSPLDYSVEGMTLKCVIGFERDCTSSTQKGDCRPVDLRDWAVLAYLGQCQNYFQQPKYISAIRPTCVCWDTLLFYNFNGRLTRNRYYESLNCSIVALCHVKEDFCLISKDPHFPNTVYDEPENECIGFGFVQGIDEEQHLLYIVTPLELNSLKRVNTIMNGNIVMPRAVLMNQPTYEYDVDYTNDSTHRLTQERKPIKRRSRHNNSFKKCDIKQ